MQESAPGRPKRSRPWKPPPSPFRPNDLVDIGVFAEAKRGEKDGRPLYLRKHRIGPGTQRIRVAVAEKPARAGIDPLNKLIDRISDDNVVAVKQASR